MTAREREAAGFAARRNGAGVERMVFELMLDCIAVAMLLSRENAKTRFSVAI